MNWKRGLLLICSLAMLSGCATMPTGPTVAVLPGPGKPFEVFMADDAVCRQWAQQSIGGASPSETANKNTATGAIVGTAVGAAMGLAIGAATGGNSAAAGAGAAIGGGAGLLGGTAMGSNAGANSEYQLQRRYDIAYQQCMYAKGNQIPGSAPARRTYAAPPPPPPTEYHSQSQGGTWVVVPGQYVNGKWVPEHKVQVQAGTGPAPSPPPPAQPGPYAPSSSP
ncbi:MAG TPA: hypothetical protein VMT71_12415 [Syntrophorhabdales bacterium]|nr:hypothetical protein [Syntrophorhabdales bacterium]